MKELFSPWFDDIDQDILDKIEGTYVELVYKKGEIICKQGAFANQVIFVKDGLLKLYKEYGDKSLILKFVKEGEFIGLSSLYNQYVYHYTASCLNETKVCSLSMDSLEFLVSNNHDFAKKILETTNGNISTYFDRVLSVTQKQLHGRIADAILHLSNDIYKSDKFNLLLTRSDIADFCGVSTESAIRTLKELHNDKIINIQGKHMEIISKELLERLSKIG